HAAHHSGDRVCATDLGAVPVQSLDAFVAVRGSDWPHEGNRPRPRDRGHRHDTPRHRPQRQCVGTQSLRMNGADAVLSFVRGRGLSDRRAQLVWDLIALNSTPSLALHKEPEVAVGTMGIGLDYAGFGLQALPAGDLERIFSAYPRLKMKQRFSDTCCRLVTEKPETSYDNFLRDFGERFVPGYKAVSTVDLLMNAPFEE